MHTPDSSRYWIAESYEDRFQNGLEPENIDKVRDGFLTCSVHFIYISFTPGLVWINTKVQIPM